MKRLTAPRSLLLAGLVAALEIRKGDTETRSVGGSLEIKGLDDAGEFEGHGSVFNNEDSYGDVVLPGAFQKSLEEHRTAGTLPAMLWQHDPAQPIGVYSDVREDSKGLYVKGRLLTETTKGKEAHDMLKAGAVRGLSIGFVTRAWEWREETRLVKDVDLWEVSLVTFPANRAAQVEDVKNSRAIPTTERELDKFLRDVGGLSRSEAKAAIAGLRESILERRDASEGMGKAMGAAERLLEKLKQQ